MRISESDNALCSAMKKELESESYRLYVWTSHVIRGKNFWFLKLELQAIKNKIRTLPYEKYKERFDRKVDEVLAFSTTNKLQKQKDYFEKNICKKRILVRLLLSFSVRWFDGGISTMSRAEAWNALIKRDTILGMVWE